VYVARVNMGGKMPAFAMNLAMRMTLSTTERALHYFQDMRELHEYDLDDGRDLGMRLMMKPSKREKLRNSKKKKVTHRWHLVESVVKTTKGLNQLAEEYPWLVVFLKEAVRGRLHMNSPVDTHLDVLTEMDGKRIGMNLSQALRQRKTPEAGMYVQAKRAQRRARRKYLRPKRVRLGWGLSGGDEVAQLRGFFPPLTPFFSGTSGRTRTRAWWSCSRSTRGWRR
jgi:hypothetical protein